MPRQIGQEVPVWVANKPVEATVAAQNGAAITFGTELRAMGLMSGYHRKQNALWVTVLVLTLAPQFCLGQCQTVKEEYEGAMKLVHRTIYDNAKAKARAVPGAAPALLLVIQHDPTGAYGEKARTLLMNQTISWPDWDGHTGLAPASTGMPASAAKEEVVCPDRSNEAKDPKAMDTASLRQLAEAGNAHAQKTLGDRYNASWDKYDLPRTDSYLQALSWYSKAAAQGDHDAEYSIAFMYYNQLGVRRDRGQFLSWMCRAAQGGLTEASQKIAEVYEKGWGWPVEAERAQDSQQDSQKAEIWRKRSRGEALPISCSEFPPASLNLSQRGSSRSSSQINVVSMLEESKSKHISLSGHDQSELRSSDESFNKSMKWYLNHCNKENFDDGIWNTSKACYEVGTWIEKGLGAQSSQAEIAFTRACAFHDATDFQNKCVKLGEFYERRGELAMALAVYQQAPYCNQPYRYALEREACTKAAAQAAIILSPDRSPGSDWMTAIKRLCFEYQDPDSCRTFNVYGGSADLEAAVASHREIQETDRAASVERTREEDQARQQRQRESDARFNAVMGNLQSMSGGNDPNAIVNAGNEQAAQIRAIGDANAAQQQQAAQARIAAQQAAAQQAAQARLAQQQTSSAQQTPRPALAPPPVPITGKGLAPNNGNGVTSGASNLGTASSGASSAPSNGGSCTNMNKFVTGTVKVASDGFVVGHLTNNSNQTLYVSYTFARGGKPYGPQSGAVTVRPGQTVGGEGGGIWSTGDAVDTNPPGIFWFAVLQSDVDQAKNCGSEW